MKSALISLAISGFSLFIQSPLHAVDSIPGIAVLTNKPDSHMVVRRIDGEPIFNTGQARIKDYRFTPGKHTIEVSFSQKIGKKIWSGGWKEICFVAEPGATLELVCNSLIEAKTSNAWKAWIVDTKTGEDISVFDPTRIPRDAISYTRKRTIGYPTTPVSSFPELKEKGLQGDVKTQYLLGQSYMQGLLGPQDYAEAAIWYKKAAEQGHAGAQFDLGVLYYLGHGVPQDYLEAYTWFHLSNLNEYPRAAEFLEDTATRLAPPVLDSARVEANKRSEKLPSMKWNP